MAREQSSSNRKLVIPEAPDPGHRWDRPLQAPGHMQEVTFALGVPAEEGPSQFFPEAVDVSEPR
jgi:hypothetical protein